MRAVLIIGGAVYAVGLLFAVSVCVASGRADRAAARRQRLKDLDGLTDSQVDRLLSAIATHPSGHAPRKRYYR